MSRRTEKRGRSNICLGSREFETCRFRNTVSENHLLKKSREQSNHASPLDRNWKFRRFITTYRHKRLNATLRTFAGITITQTTNTSSQYKRSASRKAFYRSRNDMTGGSRMYNRSRHIRLRLYLRARYRRNFTLYRLLQSSSWKSNRKGNPDNTHRKN